MAYPEKSVAELRVEALTPTTGAQVAFSVGLVPAAIVLAAVIGWLALRLNLYYLLLLAIPMGLIALSCLGLRGIRALATT